MSKDKLESGDIRRHPSGNPYLVVSGVNRGKDFIKVWLKDHYEGKPCISASSSPPTDHDKYICNVTQVFHNLHI